MGLKLGLQYLIGITSNINGIILACGFISEVQDVQDEVSYEYLAVSDSNLGEKPLAGDVQKEAESGDCHQFYWRCRGLGGWG